MFLLNLRSVLRSLWLNKVNSLINIIGLATGLGACIVIILWVTKEYRVNKYLPGGASVYEVITNYQINGSAQSARATSFPIISALRTSVTGIDNSCYVKIEPEHYSLRTDAENPAKEITATGYLVSQNFFEIFDRRFLAGSRKSALQDPLSVAISEKLAYQLFGANWRSSALGKTIYFNGSKEADIAGIFEDFPETSTVRFDYCLSLPLDTADNIGNFNYDTYVRLKHNSTPAQVQEQANKTIIGKTNSKIVLQPFTDIYLYSNFSNGNPDGGRIEYVRLFVLAAAFILFMACINFMNLYSAGSFKQAKEVGIRRIIGAGKPTIFSRFFTESVLLTALSVILALTAVIVCLPWIDRLIEDHLSIPFGSVIFWTGLVVLLIFTALLAGIYPASLLTSFQPITVVRANNEIRIGGVKIRKGLFIFQFFISVALITFTYGMARQISYLRSKNLGYDKHNLIYKELSQNELLHIAAIKQKLQAEPFIKGVTVCSSDLQNGGPMVGGVEWPDKPANDSSSFAVIFTDSNFIHTMKIPIAMGKPGLAFTGNRVPVYINERAAAIMGGRDKILNKNIKVWGADGEVAGIVTDFHFNSLFSPIQPLILANVPGEVSYLIARVQTGRQQEAIADFATIHREYSPNKLFSFDWIEDTFQRRYQNEANMDKIATIFSFLSVFIACLGLLGLANITVRKRTRELGIRKTLGASRYQIITLIFWEFFRQILVSVLIAIPIAYVILSNWLQKFAYHSPISFVTFAFPVGLMIAVAVLTLLYHAIRVTSISPVSSIQQK
jgi:putative ABC transport system permease protein